jgi:phosphonate metabolism protein PhnN/1,5-bisphosphokinase (PRPP-forming)
LIVGPSGAGKDTLIAAARSTLDARFVFPRRVITRAAQPDDEDHETVDPSTFEARERSGAFGLSWRAHGLSYGVPNFADALERGSHVVVNVSRTAVADARDRFANVRVILVTASREALRARLKARGREAEHAIDARLERTADVVPDAVIVNDGAPGAAIQAFLAALKG